MSEKNRISNPHDNLETYLDFAVRKLKSFGVSEKNLAPALKKSNPFKFILEYSASLSPEFTAELVHEFIGFSDENKSYSCLTDILIQSGNVDEMIPDPSGLAKKAAQSSDYSSAQRLSKHFDLDHRLNFVFDRLKTYNVNFEDMKPPEEGSKERALYDLVEQEGVFLEKLLVVNAQVGVGKEYHANTTQSETLTKHFSQNAMSMRSKLTKNKTAYDELLVKHLIETKEYTLLRDLIATNSEMSSDTSKINLAYNLMIQDGDLNNANILALICKMGKEKIYSSGMPILQDSYNNYLTLLESPDTLTPDNPTSKNPRHLLAQEMFLDTRTRLGFDGYKTELGGLIIKAYFDESVNGLAEFEPNTRKLQQETAESIRRSTGVVLEYEKAPRRIVELARGFVASAKTHLHNYCCGPNN